MKEESWGKREFSEIDLGDKRLNERLINLVDTLSDSPESSINRACENWAETKAAYRFFKNEKVDSDKIISAHRDKTVNRAQEHNIILALQDTTYIMYSHHPKTSGLSMITPLHGRSESGIYSKGLIMHTCLAVTTEGTPLGLLDQSIELRTDVTGERKDDIPIEEKESYKWLKSMNKSVEPMDNTQVVTICDREADIYEFIELSRKLGTNVLIRANADRSINKRSMYTRKDTERLWSYMDQQTVCGSYYVDVQETKNKRTKNGHDARIAHVEVKYGNFTLNSPRRFSSSSPDIPMYAVYVIEKDPPENVEPLEWMLITNLPVESFDDACEKIRWYKLRWRIEMFFKVLKSGFNVEDCRLNKGIRLVRYVTVMSIIACRLFTMTLLARSNPEEPPSSILSPLELKVLSLKTNKKKKGTKINIHTIKAAVISIARLGGFLARKNDGYPGSIVLWRGWKRLQDLIEGFQLARTSKTCG